MEDIDHVEHNEWDDDPLISPHNIIQDLVPYILDIRIYALNIYCPQAISRLSMDSSIGYKFKVNSDYS